MKKSFCSVGSARNSFDGSLHCAPHQPRQLGDLRSDRFDFRRWHKCHPLSHLVLAELRINQATDNEGTLKVRTLKARDLKDLGPGKATQEHLAQALDLDDFLRKSPLQQGRLVDHWITVATASETVKSHVHATMSATGAVWL